MPTVSKDIAEEQIEHNKKLKRPRMYCIVKYWNTLSKEDNYSLCYKEDHYQGLFESSAVAGVVILWANPRSGLNEGPLYADSGPLTDQELWEEMGGDGPVPKRRPQTRKKTE